MGKVKAEVAREQGLLTEKTKNIFDANSLSLKELGIKPVRFSWIKGGEGDFVEDLLKVVDEESGLVKKPIRIFTFRMKKSNEIYQILTEENYSSKDFSELSFLTNKNEVPMFNDALDLYLFSTNDLSHNAKNFSSAGYDSVYFLDLIDTADNEITTTMEFELGEDYKEKYLSSIVVNVWGEPPVEENHKSMEQENIPSFFKLVKSSADDELRFLTNSANINLSFDTVPSHINFQNINTQDINSQSSNYQSTNTKSVNALPTVSLSSEQIVNTQNQLDAPNQLNTQSQLNVQVRK